MSPTEIWLLVYCVIASLLFGIVFGIVGLLAGRKQGWTECEDAMIELVDGLLGNKTWRRGLPLKRKGEL